MEVASHWKSLEPLPALNSAHGPIEVPCNRLPCIKSRHRSVHTEITNRRPGSYRARHWPTRVALSRLVANDAGRPLTFSKTASAGHRRQRDRNERGRCRGSSYPQRAAISNAARV